MPNIYVGVNDHKVDLFEGQYRVPNGMSYNSYVITGDKIAVMDTVDWHFADEWLANVAAAVGERKPDYLVVQHMEPDHSASIRKFLQVYPQTTVVGNAKTFTMMENFYGDDIAPNRLVVADKQTLDLGEHTLTFVFAPMVHWPEVMVTYDSADKTLYSADAFGKFGALDVSDDNWVDEARRYYIGIVGKYGIPVQTLLKKAAALDIATICPLHGPVLTENLGYYLGLYDTWSKYNVEENGVCICYTSVYGNTAEAVGYVEGTLRDMGVTVVTYDLARCDMSAAVADAFRYGKLVLASTTYNNDVFPPMRTFISALAERSFQKRDVYLIENGSWAPNAARVMREMLANCKNVNISDMMTIYSRLDPGQTNEIVTLVKDIVDWE